MLPGESLLRCAAPAVVPHDLVLEVLVSEDAVHQRLDVGVRGVVDMKVDAPVLPQDAPHLHEPHSHPAQERRHVHPIRHLRRLDHRQNRRPVVLDLICPFRMHIIVPPPAVGEPCPGRKAIRRRVEVLVLVERRIGCDEVDCVAVHPPQESQVVPVVQRPIPKVDFRHSLSPYLRGGWISRPCVSEAQWSSTRLRM